MLNGSDHSLLLHDSGQDARVSVLQVVISTYGIFDAFRGVEIRT